MKDNKKILTKADVGLAFLPANKKDFIMADTRSDNSKGLKDACAEGEKIQPVIRAIYIGDIRFDSCPVFELDEEDGYFKILDDPEFRYTKEEVESDKNFIRFLVNEYQVKLLNN